MCRKTKLTQTKSLCRLIQCCFQMSSGLIEQTSWRDNDWHLCTASDPIMKSDPFNIANLNKHMSSATHRTQSFCGESFRPVKYFGTLLSLFLFLPFCSATWLWLSCAIGRKCGFCIFWMAAFRRLHSPCWLSSWNLSGSSNLPVFHGTDTFWPVSSHLQWEIITEKVSWETRWCCSFSVNKEPAKCSKVIRKGKNSERVPSYNVVILTNTDYDYDSWLMTTTISPTV